MEIAILDDFQGFPALKMAISRELMFNLRWFPSSISQSPLRLAYADKDGCEVVGCAKEQVDDLVHKSSVVLRGATKIDRAG